MIFTPIIESDRSSASIRLQTYFNYFKAVEIALVSSKLSAQPDIVRKMKAINGTPSRKSAAREQDVLRLKQCLFHSWNSRMILRQYNYVDDEFLGMSVPWIPTMYYYAFYHCLQAYFRSSGKTGGMDHASALHTITSDIGRFPTPISFLCVRSYNQNSIVGYNDNFDRSFSNLRRPSDANCKDHIAKLLCTTRDEVLKEAFRNRRKQCNKKTLTDSQKTQVDISTKPTSIFHFLYRVRKKFNYEDGEVSMLEDGQAISPRDMYLAIKGSYTPLILATEWLVAQYAGKNTFIGIFDDYAKALSKRTTGEQIQLLRDQIDNHYK